MTRLREIRVVAMAVLVGLLIASGMSVAGGSQHSGKAPRWRTLTDSDETTTSKCIGKPVTPICAVETARACFDRSQIDLCRIAFLNGESRKFHLGPPSPGYKTEYTIVKYQTIRHVPPLPLNVRRALEREGRTEKPGDIRIDFTARVCPVTRDNCAGEPSETFGSTTRHVAGRWLVIEYWAFHQPE